MKLNRNVVWTTLLGISAGAIGAVGCNGSGPSQQQVQQQAEQTTVAAKQDAKDAVAATRVAAAEAEKDVNAAAAGIKSGLQQNTAGDADNRANLNKSSQIRLAMLPGISMSKAGEIIDHRPYANAHQLVTRGLLTEDEYLKIAADVTAR
jgi:DNA uptake protein ComE-like DNA-binding protein